MSALIGGAIAAGASIASGMARHAGSLIDVANSPNQLRSSGNIPDATLMNGTMPFMETYVIDDWDIVADTYEKTGYRVDEVRNDVYMQNFQGWLEKEAFYLTRHYYNPLQLSSCELEGTINIPSGLLGDFEMRLKNGVRFWNVSYDGVRMGDFEYDNAEEAYING